MFLYQQHVKQQCLIQSISRKGNCLDNAAMKSFFKILNFHGEQFKSVDELQ